MGSVRHHTQTIKEKEAKALKLQQQEHQLEMRKGFFVKKKLNKVDNWEKIEKANAVAKKGDKSEKYQLDAIFQAKRGIMLDVDKEVTSHMQNLAADYKTKKKIYDYIHPELAHELKLLDEEKNRSQSLPVKKGSDRSMSQMGDPAAKDASHKSIMVMSMSKFRDFEKDSEPPDMMLSPQQSMVTNNHFFNGSVAKLGLLKTVSAMRPADTETSSSHGERKSRVSIRKSSKFQSESLAVVTNVIASQQKKVVNHSAALPLITQASMLVEEHSATAEHSRSRSELAPAVPFKHDHARQIWKQSAFRTTAGPELVHLRQVEEAYSRVTTPSNKNDTVKSRDGTARPKLIILPAADGGDAQTRPDALQFPERRGLLPSKAKTGSIDRFKR